MGKALVVKEMGNAAIAQARIEVEGALCNFGVIRDPMVP